MGPQTPNWAGWQVPPPPPPPGTFVVANGAGYPYPSQPHPTVGNGNGDDMTDGSCSEDGSYDEETEDEEPANRAPNVGKPRELGVGPANGPLHARTAMPAPPLAARQASPVDVHVLTEIRKIVKEECMKPLLVLPTGRTDLLAVEIQSPTSPANSRRPSPQQPLAPAVPNTSTTRTQPPPPFGHPQPPSPFAHPQQPPSFAHAQPPPPFAHPQPPPFAQPQPPPPFAHPQPPPPFAHPQHAVPPQQVPAAPQMLPRQQPGVQWSNTVPPPPVPSPPQREVSAVDLKWGVLFDQNGLPTKRWEQVLGGVGNYLVSSTLHL